MKAAIVFSIPTTTTKRFAWRWRSEDDAQESARSFGFYADCAADAEHNGYKVRLGGAERRNDVSTVSSAGRA